jgi:threonine dehydrogenase-like Zn-dependent dehydrogenase
MTALQALSGDETKKARCLTYVAPGKAEIVAVQRSIGDAALDEGLHLTAVWSGVSRGTERLVFNGHVPESEFERMRAPFQHGAFPFPVGYGYAWVGQDEQDGRHYFGLFPHQDMVIAPADALVPLPDGLDPRRAVLGANMETALNIVWDAGAGPGDRITVVGGGVLGLLVAGLVAGIPGTSVTVVDLDQSRAEVAEKFGARFALPEDAPGGRDIVIHTSASEAGIETALSLAGMEAVVVEASWYGDARPRLPLGGAFHSRRLTLKSSQVGMVSAGRRARFTHRRRLQTALGLLLDDKYDALITGEVGFLELPSELPRILGPAAGGLATVVAYP